MTTEQMVEQRLHDERNEYEKAVAIFVARREAEDAAAAAVMWEGLMEYQREHGIEAFPEPEDLA